MIRKHLSSIVYLALILTAAVPYGLFVSLVRMPLWLTLLACAVTGLVVAVVTEPVARAIVHRIQDRERVRSLGQNDSDAE
ncbi:hypothetical protein [Streptomyces sp. NPDC004728]|uniref:hypothetical protein n=1 Tax=Streptomyces sp. NPDC004728 TaxID=3154289 RepID=UPI0033A2E980